MKGVDTLGLSPHFDGTGYPRWKVLMEAYLQAKDLDVWRVTDEGMKNGTKKAKQFDVITKSIILFSLDVGIFNRVFNCENAHELWKTIKEQNEGSKEVANERYGCLLEEFNSFKQLANENAKSMYSRLNVLVNEFNALGVKNITDLNIKRKILQSLRKADYDLVKAIIYDKKLEELKSSHILSKTMAHELQIMPKSKKAPQEPSSPTTSHALSSQQEKVMSRMATHGSSSKDDCDDGDDEDSSSDEEFESMVAEYVKKIFKYVKKVNMYSYNVHLREGRHHQHIKFTKIEHKPKNKVVKERRPKKEANVVVHEWTSGGEPSSSSSSVESRKNFTTCIMQGPSSSLHMCLMAQGMENNVSDDASDTTSLDDLVELVHEQKGMLEKQANGIKEINALNDLSATLATNYEHLLCKFKFLSKECDELKSKLESNETKTSDSFELDESSIPCAIPISKVDASTSCIDLIDESCSPSCNENVVVETCDSLIGKMNDELKQQVKWL
jgi:hypothetical protein